YLPSAQLLIPVPSWGTNYVAVVSPKTLPPYDTAYQPGWGQIVGSVDNTTVTILPSMDLPAGPGVDAAPKGQPKTFTLGAGDVIQWQDVSEMSGSILQSDKPIAFVGGSGYLCMHSKTSLLPNDISGGCDASHQLVPPGGA